MRSYYFLPYGFGFWYQVGILKNEYDKIDELIGSSSGSLISFIYLFKKDDIRFDFLQSLAYKCLKKQRQNYSLNLYKTIDYFLKEILDVINNYDEEEKKNIKKKLSKIRIQYSIIKFYYIFPYLISQTEIPENVEHLKELVKISTYIPIISYYKSYFYYKYKNKLAIDGYFTVSKKETKINIYAWKYSSIIPCSCTEAKNMYNKGLELKNIEKLRDGDVITRSLYFFYNNLKNLVIFIFSIDICP